MIASDATLAAPATPAAATTRVHVREFLADALTPIAVYRRLRQISPTRFLFESVTGGEQVSRFSFLGAGPRVILRLYADRVTRQAVDGDDAGAEIALPGAPLDALRAQLGAIRAAPVGEGGGDAPAIPFTGGWVGNFGFDLVRLVERLPDAPPDPFGLPIAVLARYDTVVAFDHARQRVVVATNEIDGEVDRADAEARLDAFSAALTGASDARALPMPAPAVLPSSATLAQAAASLDGPAFQDAVRRAKDYITAGDIFQVVLARRFAVPQAPRALPLYRALRLINPSPYMVLLELPDVTLVGASPEMLVRKTGQQLETRPIAGTRPRGADAAADARLAADLLADAKERAEHVMLVDLGRNDLGRVAAPGSVRVASFMEVERYSHVMHIVSSVTGELASARDGLDALLACFPAGTVSGAPKIRAMEIIDELEPESRGPYAGAIGYLSYTGDVDTCISIRTLVERSGETSVAAGAGIVADSDPLREQHETENKAAAVLAAVALAEQLQDTSR